MSTRSLIRFFETTDEAASGINSFCCVYKQHDGKDVAEFLAPQLYNRHLLKDGIPSTITTYGASSNGITDLAADIVAKLKIIQPQSYGEIYMFHPKVDPQDFIMIDCQYWISPDFIKVYYFGDIVHTSNWSDFMRNRSTIFKEKKQ